MKINDKKYFNKSRATYYRKKKKNKENLLKNFEIKNKEKLPVNISKYPSPVNNNVDIDDLFNLAVNPSDHSQNFNSEKSNFNFEQSDSFDDDSSELNNEFWESSLSDIIKLSSTIKILTPCL